MVLSNELQKAKLTIKVENCIAKSAGNIKPNGGLKIQISNL